jgi:hypothetical protein
MNSVPGAIFADWGGQPVRTLVALSLRSVWDGGVHERILELLREVAALLKQSGALQMRGHELSKTADELRHKAEGLERPSQDLEAKSRNLKPETDLKPDGNEDSNRSAD